jgi:hypothetical protein
MKRALGLILLLCLLSVATGCGGSATTTTAAATTTLSPATSSTSTTDTTSSADGTTTYTARLFGKDVVPAVTTDATGTATFTPSYNGSKVTFVLKVWDMTGAVAARVRQGKAGSNGTVIVTLFDGPTKKAKFTGTLAKGSFTAANLTGSLKGKTIADFLNLIDAGEAYVNVGTTKHPKGEIRGQIQ